uniref:Uncharacterized protein n=1 Tax=Amphimedon queenslandica TaxID=400682 RepID=A0A1X7SYM6_AMPQE
MKLQRYIQSLHEDLQVAHQSKVSLQEALLEAKEQVKGDDSVDIMSSALNEMRQEQEKLIKEKQIITEDFEKLKLKVADMEEKEEQYLKKKQIIIDDVQNLKIDVSEKDKVIAKSTSQAEDQSQLEKQIITDLRAKVSDNELYTTKLMKEKSQLQERVTSLEEQSIKGTSSIGPQFNYLEEVQLKKTPLPGVEIIASTNLLVAGGSHIQLHWEEYGLILDVPPDALPRGFIAEITVCVSISGPYVYPDSDTWKPASAVYWISSSRDFVNPVLLGIQHSVRGNVKSSEIKVLMADDIPTQNMSFVFQDYSNFTLNGPYVYLLLNHFSGISVASTAELSFEGILFKSQKANYVWDYSFVVYKSHTRCYK